MTLPETLSSKVTMAGQQALESPSLPFPSMGTLDHIPIDVLCEIFQACLPTDGYPVMTPTEAPILLTRVSRTWRSMAHHTAPLWTRLHIAVPEAFQGWGWGNAIESEDANRLSTILERRTQLAEDWLSYTGASPLSLSIDFLDYPFDASTVRQQMIVAFLGNVFDLVVHHAHHIQAISFTAPLVGIVSAEKQLSGVAFPQLSEVALHIHWSARDHHVVAQAYETLGRGAPSSILLAPNIKRLTFVNGPQWTTPRLTPQPSWRGLTHLDICSNTKFANIHLIFNLCPSLVFLRLRGVVNFVDDKSPPLCSTFELPFLKTLHLLLCGFDSGPAGIGQILDAMCAPSLEDVAYAQATDLEQSPIIKTLKKSMNIHTLSLEAPVIPPQVVTAALNQVRATLTRLIIGSPCVYNDWEDEFGANDEKETDDTFVNHYDGSEIDLGDHILRWLPCLDSLTMFHLRIINTDANLLQLITERIDLWKNNEASLIRDIKIILTRARQKDIVPEIYKYAEAAGATVNVQLSYRRPLPEDRENNR